MTNNRAVRVGIAGVGRAQEHRIPAFLELAIDGVCDVVGVCDIDGARAERVAGMFQQPGSFGPQHERTAGDRRSYSSVHRERFPAPRVYDDVAAMAAKVDLVVVCTHPDTHKELTLTALAHGRGVLCEQPMAVNLTDAKEMVDAARAADCPLSIGYPYAYGVPDGTRLDDIGALDEVSSYYLLADNIPLNPDFWSSPGSGVWLELARRPISAALPLLSGRPVSVSAEGRSFWGTHKHGPRFRGVDTAVANVAMSEGPPLNVHVSWKTGAPTSIGVAFNGSVSTWRVPLLLARELDAASHPMTRERTGVVVGKGLPALLYSEAIAAQHLDVLRAVADGTPLRFPAERALYVERIVHAGGESIRTGERVTV